MSYNCTKVTVTRCRRQDGTFGSKTAPHCRPSHGSRFSFQVPAKFDASDRHRAVCAAR